MTSVIFALGLAYYAPVVLEPGVVESRTSAIEFPLLLSDKWRQKCEAFRLWVSEDQGKTWRLHEKVGASGTRFPFTAPKDGSWKTVFSEKSPLPPSTTCSYSTRKS